MKIVIDLPEEIMEHMKDNGCLSVVYYNDDIAKAIINGTPLPKGHGRLIDADAYIDKTAECDWLDDIPVDEFNRITPTIIEADKGAKND